MSSAARTARTNVSPTIPAATATARSVRARLQDNGSPSARPSSCRFPTITSSSPCRLRSSAIAFHNKPAVYDLLFRTAAETLIAIAADPKHLGARIGLTAVLHTWGSSLTHHPHVHVIVPGGGLSPDGSRWIACKRGFFLPVRVLSRLFRRLFLEGLEALHAAGRLAFFGDLASLAEEARLRRRPRTSASLRMDGLRQEAVRRAKGRSHLSRPLHPSRRDLEFPSDRPRRQGRHLQMEGLSVPRPPPAQDHDARRRRVHPSLSPARAAERLPSHPPYVDGLLASGFRRSDRFGRLRSYVRPVGAV